ncbi:hypothetical protein QMT40_003019 [Parvibaculaceae bacterium PLY_AMNH_Bact1]|nr:hypothetical protein QMT40_003019 [Parvibaculaceae bacterium PLY_AMNH_Bact1]
MTDTGNEPAKDITESADESEYEIRFWKVHQQTFVLVNGGLLALSVAFLAAGSIQLNAEFAFTVCSLTAVFNFLNITAQSVAVDDGRDGRTFSPTIHGLTFYEGRVLTDVGSLLAALFFAIGLCLNVWNSSVDASQCALASTNENSILPVGNGQQPLSN